MYTKDFAFPFYSIFLYIFSASIFQMLSFPISFSWAKLSSFQTWETLVVGENYFIKYNALPSKVQQCKLSTN